MGRNYTNFKGKNNPNYKHGLCGSGLYTSWKSMRQRCFNKKHPKFKNYGGRGISVCGEWGSADSFSKWAIKNGWKDGLQLDRINNDGDYEPKNCRWVSVSENARKKSTTKLSMRDATEIRKRLSNGENSHDLAEEYGVVNGTIWFIEKNFTHVAGGLCSKRRKK